MQWELREVKDMAALLDDSGVYVVVHRIETTETHKEFSGVRVSVRADLMRRDAHGHTSDSPIVSFVGSANAVRKHLIRFLADYSRANDGTISWEHASYIGYELLRAEIDPNYVQD